MNTKIEWSAVSILVVAILGVAILFYQIGQKTSETSATTEKQTIKANSVTLREESDTRTYKNTLIGFTLNIPTTWRYTEQNEAPDWYDVFFYDEKYEADVKSDSNAMLALIDKKAPHVSLNVNGSDFVKARDFNIKDQVTTPAGGPNGTFDMKLLSWEEKVATNGQKFFVYSTEIQTDGGIKEYGIVWVANSKLFELKSRSATEQPVMDGMARSFTVTSTMEAKTVVYKNSDFGSEFTLTLPETWKDYIVEKSGTNGVNFYLPKAKYVSVLKYPTERVPVLFIEGYPKSKIDTLKPKCANADTLNTDDQYLCNWLPVAGKSYYLGQNNQYYFSFRGPVGEPTINIDDFPIKASQELNILEQETRTTVASFKGI